MEETKQETRVRHYEMLYIIPVKYTVDELPAVQSKIKDMLAEYGCQLTYEEDLGKRKLSYPISQIHHGYYYVVEFNLEAANLIKLDTALRLSSEVLRHLIVSKVERSAAEMAAAKERQAKREAEEEQQLKDKIDSRSGAAPVEKKEVKPVSSTAGKVSIADLDKKLDELIDESIL